MSSEPKQPRVECRCPQCGPSGQIFSERNHRRHLQQELFVPSVSTVELPEYATPKINLTTEILTNKKLNRLIVGDFTVLKLVRAIIEIRADNPSVPIEVIDSFLQLFIELVAKFGGDVNIIPRTFAAMESLIKPLIPEVQKVPVCYQCGVRPRYPLDEKCTKCGSKLFDKEHRPLKRLHIIPLIPRLRQLMQVPMLARLLKQRKNLRPLSDFKSLSHLKSVPTSNEVLTIRLLFSTDGGCPWQMMNRQYSVWPGTLDLLNWPKHLQRDLRFTLLVYLSDGLKKPADMNTLIDYLTRELIFLDNGIEVYDSDADKLITLKCKLELICADWPAFCALHHVPSATAKKDACPHCPIPGVRNRLLSKQIYTTPSTLIISKDKPDYDIVRAILLSRDNDRAQQYVLPFGKKNVESFAKLSYFDASCYVIDPMHLVCNIAKKLYTSLSGFDKKCVLQAEVEAGRLNRAEYTLSSAQLKTAQETLAGVVIPSQLFDRPHDLFSKNFPTLKSHTWIRLITSGVLLYTTQDHLKRKQYEALCSLTRVIRVIISHNIRPDMNFDKLQKDTHNCVLAIQESFPLQVQTLQLHLLYHVPEQLRRFGPTHTYWMFNSEGYMSWLMKRMKLNKAAAESTTVNCYAMRWAASLLSVICDQDNHLSPPETSFHQKKRADPPVSHRGAIAIAWNSTHRKSSITPCDVPLCGQYYEACNNFALAYLRTNDFVYARIGKRDIAAKILYFYVIYHADHRESFIVVQRLRINTPPRCFFERVHVDFVDPDILCLSFTTAIISKPLVHSIQGSNVFILSDRDYIFPADVQ